MKRYGLETAAIRRQRSRRHFLRGAIGGSAGVAGLWLLACSSGNNNSVKSANSTVSTTAAGATVAGTRAAATAAPGGSPAAAATQPPKTGGTLTFANTTEPPNLDVHKNSTAGVAGYGPGVAYSGLIKPQTQNHNGAVIPTADLAESWERADATTLVFKLRTNAKFQNIAPVNGRAAVAQDVVYSFNRQIAEKVNASYLAGMTGISAVDANTVRLTLDAPNVDFINSLVDARNKIVAKEAVDASGDLTNGPTIGTGAWIFKEFNKGVSLTAVRNPNYFLAGLPYADGITWPYISDPSQVEAQFLAGKLTTAVVGAGGIALATANGFDKNKYRILKAAASTSNWLMFNFDKAPQFKDVRIRKALALAVDQQLISGNAYDNLGQLSSSGLVLPGPDWDLPAADLKKALTSDPQAAKQMLSAAGGLPSQTMNYYGFGSTPAVAQIVQANWKAIGFDVTLKSADNVELTGSIFNPAVANYTVATSAILHAPTFTGDAEVWLKTGGSRNSMHMSDPQLDQLIQQQKQEFDQQKRRALVAQILRLILDQAYNPSLGAVPMQTAAPNTVHNYEPPPPSLNGAYAHFAEIWFG